MDQEEFYNNIDKTLFDFDDDIDKLSEVSERYQVQGFKLIVDPSNDLEQKDEKKDENARKNVTF